MIRIKKCSIFGRSSIFHFAEQIRRAQLRGRISMKIAMLQ